MTKATVRAMALAVMASAAGRLPAQETYDLAFSAFFGGAASEACRDVEVDALGNLYVAGTTRSPDFLTTPGAYAEKRNTSLGTTRWGYNSDIFIAKCGRAGRHAAVDPVAPRRPFSGSKPTMPSARVAPSAL